MYRVQRIRLYPTRNQRILLQTHLDLCRTLYNACVEERIRAGKNGVDLGRFDQQNQLPLVKKALPEFSQVQANVLQDVVQRVAIAFKRHKTGITGAPRFKKPGKYASLTYPAHRSGFYTWRPGSIRFSKLGEIRCRGDRPPPKYAVSTRKACTIKRDGDQWLAFLRFELPDPVGRAPAGKVLGVDVGIENMITTSDGDAIENPRAFSRIERRLKRLQRRFIRRTGGGKNRAKAKNRVKRLYLRARNRRLDHLHKASRKIADRSAYIAAENNLTGLRRGMLAKHVYDAGWGLFLRMLEYKLAERGGRLIRVSHARTSQLCSGCNQLVRKALSVRIHECPKCGLRMHRDVNAAINIRNRGVTQLPRSPGEVTPAEIGSYSAVRSAVPVDEAGSQTLNGVKAD